MPIKPLRADRYILSEVIGPFLGGIVFFVFIFLMFQALRLADFFIVKGVPATILGKLVFFLSISFLPTALPVAFLIAVLVAFGRLSGDSELVAMKASGFSIPRLSAPLCFFATFVVILSLTLNMEWVPWALRTYKTTFIKVSSTKVVAQLKEGAFTSGFFDLLIFADKVDSSTNRLRRVFIYDEREAKNPLTIVAQSGEVVPVRTESELGAAALLKLHNGSIHRNDMQGNTYQKIDFTEYGMYLKADEGTESASMKPEMIPYHDLVKRIESTSVKTSEGRDWRGEYWRRVAMALSPLIFVFLGIGYGTVRTRTVRAGAALFALVILISYWGLQTLSTIFFLQKAILPPFLAMQVPNIVAILAAIPAYRRAMW